MEFKDLTNELRAVDYCCRRLIDLNMELEELNHKVKGLSHTVIELTPDQEKSPLPLPSYRGGCHSQLAMLEKITHTEQEALYFVRRINECRWMDYLDLTDQNLLMDLFVFKLRHEAVADKYGYTRKGMWKHIRSITRFMIKN